jgi:hypothetical protein
VAGSGGLTIVDDTTTNATRYLTFTSATTGTITSENVSSTKLTFNPSTGILAATGFSGAFNGTIGATTANTGAFTTLSATGVTTVQAGTASLPAITTSGDTNTGIFFPAADTIAFSEGGAEVARFDSSGNLLVGTTTQATGALLTVNGSIKGTITSGTAVASTSGTSIDFTSIPSWVKRITVMFSGVSTNSTSSVQIQIGTGGAATTSGYLSTASYVAGGGVGSSAFTSAFGVVVTASGSASDVYHGQMFLTLLDSATNKWAYSGSVSRSDATVNYFSAGSVALAGVLNIVRITTAGGTATFDAGAINILYEG